ncbi:hypothetical protein [Streptomyces sp. NRRL S-1448]|uniref:hypothetical protein n=1 Tax=Streptomyces sp. NRRL S-1448 TaxID=1463883 RepID=UPI0004C18016|nr:hypothetical protein [Streptomyces sp. NRRL S-1448]
MSSEYNFEAQRSEVAFFMEKAFQISFVYFAGVAAFFALSKSDVMTSIVRATGLPLAGLAAVVILLLNLVYVTLACACLFAVLKRGLFILTHTSPTPGRQSARESIYWKWEEFVRDDEAMGAAEMRNFAWNIDNYYMVPLFSVIVVASIISAVIALSSNSAIIQGVAALLVISHVIPVFMLRQLAILDRRCRKILQDEKRH